jgi:DNA polymerase
VVAPPVTICSVDFETYGTVELKRTGVYPYAAHHDTGIWCMAYALDEGEVGLWYPGLPFPQAVADHIAAGGEMRAWNAAFERVMWRDCLARLGFPVPIPRDEQWHCTMAEASAMSLPRALEHAAGVLRVTEQKDMAGNRLSKQMCRPRRFDPEAGVPVWWDEPKKLQALYEYCKQDVRAERSVAKLVRRLNARERALYLLDQRMNDRGVFLDRPLVVKAHAIAEREMKKQDARLAAATDGAVTRTTRVARLKEWLTAQGLELPTVGRGEEERETLAAKALEELLSTSPTLSPEVRTALESRAEAAKSSVAKLDSMLDCVGLDDRMRGLMLYHGASTGRWSGKLVQPHNFPRGLDYTAEELMALLARIAEGDPEHRVTMADLSAALRGMMTAGPGKQLVAADFATIEVRVLAWLANETILLRQFREGRKLYHEIAGLIYDRPWQSILKPSAEYQLGKNTVLGCGFGMGWKKFMATTGVDEATAHKAVDTYRGTYPRVPMYWDEVNTAALRAVESPNEVFRAGHCKFTRQGGYLWVVLPAGRSLAYAAPKIVDRPMPWDKNDLRPAVEFSGVGFPGPTTPLSGAWRPGASVGHWTRQHLYGGLITENIVQAVARDLLADAMLRVEKAGYEVILSVHDEIVAETERGTLEHALQLMKVVPAWADGCPVDAEGWAGHRYRK